jgi:alkylation response protein AidB-like acyl-CoA dehydrogenase
MAGSGGIEAHLEVLRTEAAACETARQLTPAAVEALRATGVLRMAMGERLGGPELDPIAQILLLEQIATADPSAGWCAMIGSDGGYATAYLDEAVARSMYPSLDVATALNANPAGQARRRGDSVVVDGRWGFGSGSTHSDWLFLHCMLFDGDDLVLTEQGMPAFRMCAVPAADVRVVDTWHTTGLAGSGSHDLEVQGAVVPLERTFDLFGGTPVDPAPVYRLKWMFFINLAAVPLGLGRAAIEVAREAATTKVAAGSFTPACEDPLVQVAVARAEVLVASARTYLLDTVDAVWQAVLADGDTAGPWIRFRLANTNAFHAVKEAVGLLYEALGTTGVYRRSALDRHYRDIATMSQHVLSQTKTYVPAGRALLGLDPQSLIGF